MYAKSYVYEILQNVVNVVSEKKVCYYERKQSNKIFIIKRFLYCERYSKHFNNKQTPFANFSTRGHTGACIFTVDNP